MSHTSNRSRQTPAATFAGLPTGSAIGIIFAALFTGALISVSTGAIGWPLLALFAAAVILCTTFVQPRGIFLAAASAPILFVIAVVAAGYATNRGQISAGGTSSKTAQLLLVYPLLQLFPVLLTVTLASVAIGWVRIQLLKRQNKALERAESSQRSRQAASNRRTSSQGVRARERSRSVSVQELVTRERSGASASKKPARGGSTRISSRLGEDLYGN